MMMKKKILIVDDEPDFVNVTRMKLEAYDYEVIEASDGEEGLKKVKTENPDVILLDIVMPRMDGYTLLRKLKSGDTTRLIPVIVVTAKTGMKDLFAIEGIKDYLVKPYEDKDLLLRIEKALKKRE